MVKFFRYFQVIFISFFYCLSFNQVYADNFTKLQSELQAKSNDGDICATFDLGTLYLTHLELPTHSIDDVYSLYNKAAEKGHMQAQENLCEMYFYGVGKKHDLKSAVKWCSSAALDIYSNGTGNDQERRAGALWKANLLLSLHPEMKNFVHNGEVELNGNFFHSPEKIGGAIGQMSIWKCRGIIRELRGVGDR